MGCTEAICRLASGESGSGSLGRKYRNSNQLTLSSQGSSKEGNGIRKTGSHCRVDQLILRFGGVVALKEVNLEVRKDEILAVIGPNGAGKTALLNCINGF